MERLGIPSAIRLSTLCIRFLAHNKVCSRGESGKFVSTVRSLSVKSIASCGPATPRFSIVGILWPEIVEICFVNRALSSLLKCSICSSHTSQIQFAFFERI